MLAAGKCVQHPGGHGNSAGRGMWGSVSDSMVLLQALCWGAVLAASAGKTPAPCMLQRAGLLGEPRGRAWTPALASHLQTGLDLDTLTLIRSDLHSNVPTLCMCCALNDTNCAKRWYYD